jgi:hypothetical protein
MNERQVDEMGATRRVELVFPRSNQVWTVDVPVDQWRWVAHLNTRILSSFSNRRSAVVPSEHLNGSRHIFFVS